MKTVIDFNKDRNETITITCATSDLTGLGELLHQYQRDLPDGDMQNFAGRLHSHTNFVHYTLSKGWLAYRRKAIFDDYHEE